MDKKHYLLVYGSLRKNSSKGYNFNRFGHGTQEYIKDVKLNGYEMYSIDNHYPAICKGGESIKAELHLVDGTAFQKIKIMEINSNYRSVNVDIDGIKATLFIMKKEMLEGKYQKIKSGEWI